MNDHKSQELNELFASMAKAQAEIKVALKDSSNPFFKSKYANLQAIIEASRPALCKHGLSVLQQIVPDGNGRDCLVTMLCHSSGQWVSSRMTINPAKTDVQSLGSYITYLRRYCYGALVGVYDGQEDDDGNHVTDNYSSPAPQRPLQSSLISEDQLDLIEDELRTHPDLKKSLLAMLKLSDLKYMERSVFNDMLKKVREIIANKVSAKQGS
jgi:hypothetical protein